MGMLQIRHASINLNRNGIEQNLFIEAAEEMALITAKGCTCQEDDNDNPNFTRSPSCLI